MKIDANEAITNIKGEAVFDVLKDELGQVVRGPDGRAIATEKSLTLGDLIVEAVMGARPDEALSGGDKRRMVRVATKIAMADGYVELDDDEVAFLRARVEAAEMTALGYTRVLDALDIAQGRDAERAVDDDKKKHARE